LRARRPPPSGETGGHEYPSPSPCRSSAVCVLWLRFPSDVIVLAVRWYLRFGLSCRDVEELLTERGVEVDHVSIYRWVQRFHAAAG
jgi:transposase-like protein